MKIVIIKATNFFLSLVLLLFPIAHWKISIFGFPLYLSEIPLLVAAGVIGWRAWKEKWDWKKYLSENKLFLLGIILFLLGAVLSYAMNEKTLTGLGYLKSFFFLPVLFALLLGIVVKGRYESEKLLLMWLGGLGILAWLSIIFGLETLTYDGRLRSLYESPNYLAMLVAPGILLAMYFFFTLQKSAMKTGSIILLLVLTAVLFLTRSFGAMASIFISLFIFILLTKRCAPVPIRKVITTFILAATVAVLLFSSTEKFQALISGSDRSSLASREMIWTAAGRMIKDHPVIGIGPGNFQQEYLAYQIYFPPYLEWAVPEPHNLYLAFWLQTGLLGLAGFCTVLFAIFRNLRYAFKENHLSREERWLGSLLLALLAFHLVYGLIDTPYFKNDLAFALWGAIGLLSGWGQEKAKA